MAPVVKWMLGLRLVRCLLVRMRHEPVLFFRFDSIFLGGGSSSGQGPCTDCSKPAVIPPWLRTACATAFRAAPVVALWRVMKQPVTTCATAVRVCGDNPVVLCTGAHALDLYIIKNAYM